MRTVFMMSGYNYLCVGERGIKHISNYSRIWHCHLSALKKNDIVGINHGHGEKVWPLWSLFLTNAEELTKYNFLSSLLLGNL